MIFDGFDIQILGFAISSLMKRVDWGAVHLDKVLAVGLAGMAVLASSTQGR